MNGSVFYQGCENDTSAHAICNMHAQFAYACGCHYAAGVYQKWPSQDKKIDISSTSLLGLPFAVLFHHLLSKVLVGDSVNRCSKEVVVTSVCLHVDC